MSLYKALRKKAADIVRRKKETDPKSAYDLWSGVYDHQPENLIVFLDKSIFDKIADATDIENKTVIDFGCGTGKHWEKIYSKKPAELIGYDVSSGMIEKLVEKYPNATAYCTENDKLFNEKDNSCDIIISTLVIGYIRDIKSLFTEWNRVLKPGGIIILTDFHPDALQQGATRSFGHQGTQIVIKNYIHTLNAIRSLAEEFHWIETDIQERSVDDSVKHFYRTPEALEVFEKTVGVKLLYALQFKK